MTTHSLSPHLQNAIDDEVKKYPQKRSALIYSLRLAQDEHGHLSDEVIDAVADYLEQPRVYAYEVASFYDLYRREAKGKKRIRVCKNLSCKLRGSEELIQQLEKLLSIKVGETTADGCFSLDTAECLADCTHAPVAIINDETYLQNATIEQFADMVEREPKESHE